MKIKERAFLVFLYLHYKKDDSVHVPRRDAELTLLPEPGAAALVSAVFQLFLPALLIGTKRRISFFVLPPITLRAVLGMTFTSSLAFRALHRKATTFLPTVQQPACRSLILVSHSLSSGGLASCLCSRQHCCWPLVFLTGPALHIIRGSA